MYTILYLRYISKSYITRLFLVVSSEKTHPLHPLSTWHSVQAVVLESYLYVLGGSGNANASNKPLTLCSRWGPPGIDEAVEVDVAVVDGMSCCSTWVGWCSFGKNNMAKWCEKQNVRGKQVRNTCLVVPTIDGLEIHLAMAGQPTPPEIRPY